MGKAGNRLLYNRYMNLYYKCYRPNSEGYEEYGALGATICSEWLGDSGYKNFCIWSENNGFSEELRLYRYNKTLSYSPDNCYWGTALKVELGNKYGKLIVIKPIKEYRNKNGKLIDYYFECVCDCGNSLNALGSNIKSGKIKSCGCYRRELLIHSSHGETGTHLYWEFIHMRQRCSEKHKNSLYYKQYSGRGIKVCEEWNDKNAYPIFRDWALKNGYKDGLSLERIDVNGDYCPDNCTWIPRGEQQYNKTNTIWIGDKSLAKLARENNINPKLAYSRFKAGWDIRDILHTKPGGKRKYEKRSETHTNREE